MSVSNRVRAFFSPHKSDIESTVRVAVNEVMAGKTEVKAVNYNGAAIHVGSSSTGTFLDPDVIDDPVIDESVEPVKSDWLR